VVEALKRAAGRGVTCRAMADDLGSRGLIRSEHWPAMEAAGVKLGIALPFGLIPNPRYGRIDLRNHRKIVVIDHDVTYCGSQNCADAEFRVKPAFAPWVDAVMRIEGPVARQNQHLFISDWMTFVDEDLRSILLRRESPPAEGGFPAQAFGTGPTVRNSAMPEIFESLMFAARREIVITTPYYVPDESMQSALCAAARRGVDTTIVVPAKNDSFIVAAASRSYYADLLEAGVKIFEYVGGLLHTKSFTVDGVVTLIGSANMDRRSFDLNYENNILLYDAKMTGDMRSLQDHYIMQSRAITQAIVDGWTIRRRLLNNCVGMLGPLL
jgi:cardiolipin synthase